MKLKFIVLFFVASNFISAQINYNKSTWFFKGNATSMIDIFTFPTVQLSVEKLVTDYIGLSLEGGYQFYNFIRTDTSFLHPSGFRINFEFRYYLSRFINTRLSNKFGRIYTGIRPFYSRNRFNASLTYKTDPGSPDWTDDDFAGKNNTFGLNFIFGFQKSITERLIMDMHAGVGVMYRSVTNSNLQYEKDAGYSLAGTEIINFFKELNLSGTSGLWPNALFGIRIGYRLYR